MRKNLYNKILKGESKELNLSLTLNIIIKDQFEHKSVTYKYKLVF